MKVDEAGPELVFSPPPSGMVVWGFRYAFRWFVPAAIALFIIVPFRGSLFDLALGAVPTALALGLIQAALYRASYRVEVGAKGVRLRRGVITRRDDFVPFARLQAVVLYEGPLQRAFGIGNVVLKTARQISVASDAYHSDAFGGGNAAGMFAFSGSIENLAHCEYLRDLVLAHAEQARVAPADSSAPAASAMPAELPVLFAQAARALGGLLGGARASVDLNAPLEFKVAPSARRLWTVEWGALAAFFFGFVGALILPVLALPLIAASFIGSWVAAGVYLRRYRIEFHAENLVVARGIVTLRKAVVPYRRIQNVNVAADPLQRWMGLRTLHIESAGPHIPEGYIDGVSVADAEHLIAYLLGRAERARFDDALGDQAAAPDARAHVLEEMREVNRLLERRLASGRPSAPRLGSAVWIDGTQVLSPDWPVWKATVHFLTWFVLWLAFLPFFVLALLGGIVGLGLVSLFLIAIPAGLVYLYFSMLRRSFSFSFGPSSLEVRYGILNLKHDLIPYRRIQAAGISSGPIERRRFGLQTLRIATAGSTVGLQEFPAVENPEPYLEFLLTKAQESFTSGADSPVQQLAGEVRRTVDLVKLLSRA